MTKLIKIAYIFTQTAIFLPILSRFSKKIFGFLRDSIFEPKVPKG